MDDKRYWYLETHPEAKLTKEEVAQGWHFCMDWDGMLVGNEMEEKNACLCDLGLDFADQL